MPVYVKCVFYIQKIECFWTSFKLSFINKFPISDVNECVRNNGGCDADANCINVEGSFKCECENGFTGDGFDCRGETVTVEYFSLEQNIK